MGLTSSEGHSNLPRSCAHTTVAQAPVPRTPQLPHLRVESAVALVDLGRPTILMCRFCVQAHPQTALARACAAVLTIAYNCLQLLTIAYKAEILVRDREVCSVDVCQAPITKLNEPISHGNVVARARHRIPGDARCDLRCWRDLVVRLGAPPRLLAPELHRAGGAVEARRLQRRLAEDLLGHQDLNRTGREVQAQGRDEASQEVSGGVGGRIDLGHPVARIFPASTASLMAVCSSAVSNSPWKVTGKAKAEMPTSE